MDMCTWLAPPHCHTLSKNTFRFYSLPAVLILEQYDVALFPPEGSPLFVVTLASHYLFLWHSGARFSSSFVLPVQIPFHYCCNPPTLFIPQTSYLLDSGQHCESTCWLIVPDVGDFGLRLEQICSIHPSLHLSIFLRFRHVMRGQQVFQSLVVPPDVTAS